MLQINDLKDTLSEHNIEKDANLKHLRDMYSVFSDVEDGIEFDGEDDDDEPDNPAV